ncbi:MAG: iron ABC transporter substrate-binding protein [Bacteroidales bacterium]
MKNSRLVEDMLGRKVRIPENIKRVIGIGPGALRLLVYLQASDMVVGVEELEKRTGRAYIFAHPELSEKPTIGPAFTGDPELIAARKPDVIFRSYSTRAEADELERKTGIPVIALRYVNESNEWNVLENALLKMGDVLGKSKRASSLTRYYRNMMDTLNHLTKEIPRENKQRAYVGGVSHRGLHGINSTSPYYEPFAFTNTRNVASPLKNNYANNEGVFLDIEQILVWRPEIIFIDLAGLDLVRQDLRKHSTAFKKVPAFKNRNIHGVHPYNWYSTNYATVLANSWYVASILYPDKFRETDIIAKTDSIYKQFLGKSVYSKMKEQYGEYSEIPAEVLFKQTSGKQTQKQDTD